MLALVMNDMRGFYAFVNLIILPAKLLIFCATHKFRPYYWKIT